MENIDKVLGYLDDKEIIYELFRHPPAFTVEEAQKLCDDIPGMHCKNLFFRDPKGRNHLLAIFPNTKNVDIKALGQITGYGRLSFASPQRMMKYLGVSPGSVSPFGLINDTNSEVVLFLDPEVRAAESITFHPNDNSATLLLSRHMFDRFLSTLKNKIELLPAQF